LSRPKSEFLGLDLAGGGVFRVALVLLRPEPPGALVGAFVSWRFGFVLTSGSGEGAFEGSGKDSGEGSVTKGGSGSGSGLGVGFFSGTDNDSLTGSSFVAGAG
jgi:hypothetical protein